MANETPPEIPSKPSTLKQFNQPSGTKKQPPPPRQPSRSVSMQECTLAPLLPPRTKTVGEKPFSPDFMDDILPLRNDGYFTNNENFEAPVGVPPSIPPRLNKQEFLRRQSEELNALSQLPQIPPKVSSKR